MIWPGHLHRRCVSIVSIAIAAATCYACGAGEVPYPDEIQAWDSMHHLQIILALEEEFGVHFDADEIDGLQTVGALCAFLDERRA